MEKGRQYNWGLIKTQMLKHYPIARELSKRDVRRGVMEKGMVVRANERKEVRGAGPVKYFPRGSVVPFESQ